MMRRLVTKELKEKRVWLGILFVVIAGGTALGTFSGLFAGWRGLPEGMGQAPPLILAYIGFLMGLTNYTSELVPGRADFLMAKPITWKRLLAAKLIAAFGGVVIITAVVGIGYWLSLPVEYWRFLSLGRLVSAIIYLSGFAFVGYIAALPFSNVLPGMLGSALVLAGVYLLGSATSITLDVYHAKSPFWAQAAWFVAAPIGALVVARFGSTLQPLDRLRRYGLVCAVIAAFVAPVSYFAPTPSGTGQIQEFGEPREVSRIDALEWSFARWVFRIDSLERSFKREPRCLVSPDGSTVFLKYEYLDTWGAMANLKTGMVSRVSFAKPRYPDYMARWVSGNTLELPRRTRVWIQSIDEQGKIKQRVLPLKLRPNEFRNASMLSPDGKALLVYTVIEYPSTLMRLGGAPPPPGPVPPPKPMGPAVPGSRPPAAIAGNGPGPNPAGALSVPGSPMPRIPGMPPLVPPKIPKHRISNYVLLMLDTGRLERIDYTAGTDYPREFVPSPKDSAIPAKYRTWAEWAIRANGFSALPELQTNRMGIQSQTAERENRK